MTAQFRTPDESPIPYQRVYYIKHSNSLLRLLKTYFSIKDRVFHTVEKTKCE